MPFLLSSQLTVTLGHVSHRTGHSHRRDGWVLQTRDAALSSFMPCDDGQVDLIPEPSLLLLNREALTNLYSFSVRGP